MVTQLIQFIIRQFAGKIAAAVSSIILVAVTHAFAWIAAQSPEIAALCNPQAVVIWLDTLAIAALNIAANQYHLDNATSQRIVDALKAAPPVMVVKAELVNPAK